MDFVKIFCSVWLVQIVLASLAPPKLHWRFANSHGLGFISSTMAKKESRSSSRSCTLVEGQKFLKKKITKWSTSFFCQFSSSTRIILRGGPLNSPKIWRENKKVKNINLRRCKTITVRKEGGQEQNGSQSFNIKIIVLAKKDSRSSWKAYMHICIGVAKIEEVKNGQKIFRLKSSHP